MFTTLKFNLANAAIRRETLHGRAYVVAPMVMLVEGVHNGSGGALLYKAADIKKAAPAWNMKPICVYHPQINGQGVSACDPDILEAQQVGVVMGAKWDGKLRAEAWIEEKRAEAVDKRIIEALDENRIMEVSTGLFTENVGEPGDWHGEAYTATATNHQPDHLALLPDQIGACSVADGAGLLQLNDVAKAAGVDVTALMARQMDVLRRMVGNAMSHGNIYAALCRVLRERLKPTPDQRLWVADVYDEFVVYEVEGDGKVTLYSLAYTSSETGVELSTDEPVEVVRVTEYRTPDGKFVGNAMTKTDGGAAYPAAAYAYVPDPEKPSTWKLRLWETPTEKETAAQVGRAIAAIGKGFRGQKVQLPADAVKGVKAKIRAAWKRTNPGKKEAEMPAVLRNTRNEQMEKEAIVNGLIANELTAWGEGDRETLMGMGEAVLEKLVPVANEGGGDRDEPEPKPNEEPKPAAGPVGNAVKTAEEFIAQAPPEIQEVLTNGLAAHKAEKTKLIADITSNKANPFTKEFLATKGLQELRGLAALARPGAGSAASGAPQMFYGGAATPATATVENAEDDGGLPIPIINFGGEEKETQEAVVTV